MASEAAWIAGNRIGGLAILIASAVWAVCALYLPREYVKPVGVTAVLFSIVLLFITQGWSF